MEKPWTSTADDWDADPAGRLFYILGGRAVDMSGWGVPISDRNPLPSDVVEVPLQRIDDPCPGMF